MTMLGDFCLGPNGSESNGVYCGDAIKLARSVPDHSVDLIFTDPPYDKSALPLYHALVEFSARVLKPSGFLLVYVGGHWKDEIMAYARQVMSYYWDFVVWEPGNSPMNWPRKVICRHKSVVAYIPPGGTGLPQCNVLSVWLGGGEDKKYHVWGQDESQARYFISCFSQRGDVVLDPFVGGGTTPAIATALGRRFVAFDVDAECCEITRARVSSVRAYDVGPVVSERQIGLPVIGDPPTAALP